MKLIKTILIGVLVVMLVLGVGKDVIAKIAIEKGVNVVTGLNLNIGNLKIGMIKTLIGIKNLKLYNPRGFEDRVMIDMPEIYVDYDLPAIFKGKIHLYDIRIDLQEFVVVKNAKGELNLDALKPVQKEQADKEPEAESKKEGVKAPTMLIDNLELKIGKVIYKDYSKGVEPEIQEYNVNINERYQNIDNPTKLVSIIVVKALMNTSIAKLTNFDLKGLEGTVGNTLKAGQAVATGALKGAEASLQETKAVASSTVSETKTVLKDTTEELKEIIKLPFGSKE